VLSPIEKAPYRGCNELCNRSVNDFMLTEKLPFKRFGMNAAYYYLMLIGHTLLECNKAYVVNEADIELKNKIFENSIFFLKNYIF
jgi:hypothetical protein